MDHPHLAVDYGFLKANHPDAVGATSSGRLEADVRRMADQGSNSILVRAEAKYGLTLKMTVPGRAMLHHDWRDSLGSQTANLRRQRASLSRTSPGDSEVEERN